MRPTFSPGESIPTLVVCMECPARTLTYVVAWANPTGELDAEGFEVEGRQATDDR